MAEKPALRSLIGSRYIRSNAETHRRRATRLDPPLASLYVAIQRPPDWPRTFENFLRAILQSINQHPEGSKDDQDHRRKADDLLGAALDHFRILDSEGDAEDDTAPLDPDATPTPAKVRLTASFRDARWHRGKWRVEAHRDFIAITIFVGLDLIRTENDLCIIIQGRNRDPGLSRTFTIGDTSGIAFADGLIEYIFKDICDLLEHRFDPLVEAISRPRTPVEALDSVSASIFGATIPWTLVNLVKRKPSATAGEQLDLFHNPIAPEFPTIDSPGFKIGRDDKHLQANNAYLSQIWASLEGEESLLSRESSDNVACCVLNGHGIYISSLGSQIDGQHDQPLKYLLMYQDPAVDSARRSGQDLPPLLPSSERWHSGTHNYNFSWRISRFIARLHELGSLRLKALSEYQFISPFLQRLRDVEREIKSKGDAWTIDELIRLERSIENHSFPGGKSIVQRAQVARHYKVISAATIEDLAILPLPTFQPYNQFLRRRVLGTVDRMTSAVERLDGVMRRLNSLKISLRTLSILKIQRLADLVGLLIFFVYFTEISTLLFESLYHRIPVWWGGNWGAWIRPAELGLLAGLVVSALFAKLGPKWADR